MEDDEDEEEEDEEISNKKVSNELTDKQSGCVVKEGEIYNGYAILMTKIDVSFGAFGLYNYYRMQVRNSFYIFGADMPRFEISSFF